MAAATSPIREAPSRALAEECLIPAFRLFICAIMERLREGDWKSAFIG
jgi:hypothetical protein